MAYSLIMGAVYIINQITDIETDRINKKLFILPEGLVSLRAAYIEFFVLIILAFFFSFTFSPLYKIFLLFSFILGLLYSIRPFKFKGRPFFDLLSNAFGYGFLAFSIGFLSVKNFSLDTFLYSIPYIFAVGAVFVNTTIPDIEGDRKSGEITTGVFIGAKNASLFAVFLMLFALVSAFLMRDFICLPCALVSIPLYLWVYLVDDKKRTRASLVSVRISSPLLALAVCVLYPWFLLLLLFVFFSSRFYYRKRFGIVYPSI